MFGKRAVELLREVVNVLPEHLPAYNDEGVRLVLEEVEQHNSVMHATIRRCEAAEVQRRLQEGLGAEEVEEGGEDVAVDWSFYPEEVSSIVVHHDSILRNKRVLLTYMTVRLDAVRELRWQRGRTLLPELRAQLSPSELQYFKSYDKLLSKYMRKGAAGVGMDLTLDQRPPKDPNVEVQVMYDYGEVVFAVGPTTLAEGTFHLLPRAEAEPLIRQGVLKNVEYDMHLT